MSDNPTPDAPPTDEPAPQQPAQAPQQPPQQPPAQPPAQTHTVHDSGRQNGSSDVSALATEIAALPEKIVSAIREATQPPKAPATDPPAQQQQEHKEPGRKSFAEWWFGK